MSLHSPITSAQNMTTNIVAAISATPTPATPESVDPTLALWGIVGICAVVTVGLIAFTIISVALVRTQALQVSESLEVILGNERALQLVTVAAIIVALLFLSIAGRLNEGTIGILGSVSGYVLGNLSKKESRPARAITGKTHEPE
jgi:hypothetical protein